MIVFGAIFIVGVGIVVSAYFGPLEGGGALALLGACGFLWAERSLSDFLKARKEVKRRREEFIRGRVSNGVGGK